MRKDFNFCGKRCTAYKTNVFSSNPFSRDLAELHLQLFGVVLCVCHETITGAARPIEDLMLAEIAKEAYLRDTASEVLDELRRIMEHA